MRNNEPMPKLFSPVKAIQKPMTTMLCDPEKMNSANVSINVLDGRTKRHTDANVVYSCGKEGCPIGETYDGHLVTQFPICIGGVLSLEAEDYHPAYAALDTDGKDIPNMTLVIEPYRLMNFDIKYCLLSKGVDWEIQDTTCTVRPAR